MNEAAITIVVHGLIGWIAVGLYMLAGVAAVVLAYRTGRDDERHKWVMRDADDVLDGER